MQKNIRQNPTSIPNKIPQEFGNGKVLPHPMKGTFEKPTADIIFSGERVLSCYNQEQGKNVCSQHFYRILYQK